MAKQRTASKPRLTTDAPPIQTADGHDIQLNDCLYLVEKRCSCYSYKFPKIESVRAIWIDLGVNRQIRMRRNNGSEFIFTAMADSCGTTEMLFADKDKARQEAVAATEDRRAELAERVNHKTDDLNEAKDSLAKHKARVDKLRKQSIPRHTSKKVTTA